MSGSAHKIHQTAENQERPLREVAVRSGHEIVAVYRDEGISGSKGRDKRPGFDAMHKDASRRKFDIVVAWSVDRLSGSRTDSSMGEWSDLVLRQGPKAGFEDCKNVTVAGCCFYALFECRA